MKVYAHYLWSERDKFQYRWRTLLQFGNSWNVIGSVVMKNPGSAKPQNEVNNEETLRQLSCFDQRPYPWYVFSVDNTMRLIERLFTIKNGGNSLNGVMQIFNLFNIRNADLEQALKDGFPNEETGRYKAWWVIDEDLRGEALSENSEWILDCCLAVEDEGETLSISVQYLIRNPRDLETAGLTQFTEG